MTDRTASLRRLIERNRAGIAPLMVLIEPILTTLHQRRMRLLRVREDVLASGNRAVLGKIAETPDLIPDEMSQAITQEREKERLKIEGMIGDLDVLIAETREIVTEGLLQKGGYHKAEDALQKCEEELSEKKAELASRIEAYNGEIERLQGLLAPVLHFRRVISLTSEKGSLEGELESLKGSVDLLNTITRQEIPESEGLAMGPDQRSMLAAMRSIATLRTVRELLCREGSCLALESAVRRVLSGWSRSSEANRSSRSGPGKQHAAVMHDCQVCSHPLKKDLRFCPNCGDRAHGHSGGASLSLFDILEELKEINGHVSLQEWSIRHLSEVLASLRGVDEGLSRIAQCIQEHRRAGKVLRGKTLSRLPGKLTRFSQIWSKLEKVTKEPKRAKIKRTDAELAEMLKRQSEALLEASHVEEFFTLLDKTWKTVAGIPAGNGKKVKSRAKKTAKTGKKPPTIPRSRKK
ncbi:hypothetical protein ACFLU6_10965 [Acidobacteriota bacterium]